MFEQMEPGTAVRFSVQVSSFLLVQVDLESSPAKDFIGFFGAVSGRDSEFGMHEETDLAEL